MKNVKLYNVIFPFWMLLLFPVTWLVVLPANFIVDTVVLLLSMYVLKIADKKQWWKKCILKIFSIGIFSDLLGSAYMFALMMIFEVGRMGDELYITLPAIFISAVLIFVLNYFISFKKFDKPLRIKLSLIFAIVTAPYTFLIPTSWMY